MGFPATNNTSKSPYTDRSKFHTQYVTAVMVFRSHYKILRINASGNFMTPFRLDISLWS